MAKGIKFIAPIDSMSGMFGKRSHSLSGKAIISNVRKKASVHFPGGHMYFSVLTKTTFKPTDAVVQWNTTFGQISAATAVRMKDPQQIHADQIAFRAQSKYTTLYSFIWNNEREKLDKQ